MRLRVGLTGGIGSGKSTVARLLAARGAVVVDSDKIARTLLEPGGKAVQAVSEAFPAVACDGQVDRALLAARVFAEPAARERLEAIMHPLIHAESEELFQKQEAGAVVVFDVPLLVERKLAERYDLVVVVESPREARLQRLADRGMNSADAAARIAAQATDGERRSVADHVLVNDGSLTDLHTKVAQLPLGRLPYGDT